MNRSLRLYILAFSAIILLSCFFRFYNLSQPNAVVFDEVYFPVFAENYLSGKDFFDAHPPLGKLIIAIGIDTFGNNPLGWRFMNALTGMLLLLAVGGFVYDATKRLLPAFLAVLILAIDPMALVESRIGLVNIYLALFTILGLWLFWRWWRNPKELASFIGCLVLFALAGSVKWIGFGALGAALLVFIIFPWHTELKKQLRWHHLVLLVVVPFLIYILTFWRDITMRHHGFSTSAWNYVTWWHASTFGYHAHLDATHPYGSEWWTWPFSLRPLWLYFQSTPDHRVTGIIEPGNLITWIGGLVALAYAIGLAIRQKWNAFTQDKLLTFLIITYLALFIPWIVISRVKFIYHYFIPVIILHIITALVLERLIQDKRMRIPVAIFLAAGTAFFLFFLPLLMGITVSEEYYRMHLLFKSWI